MFCLGPSDGPLKIRSEENLAAFGGDLADKNDASSGRGLLKRTEPRREDAIWTYDTDLPQTEAEDPSEPIDNSNPAEKLKLKAEVIVWSLNPGRYPHKL